ncbi:glycoside hydrolase family 5 protein [Caulobacter sp.]|uniref:glycoside hydrolase family 5 protein n=1 Tax=Caulobacter sp. TaxID=78 RepID=UPI001B1A2941|nr:glycoside hydrolase family 5 protein [Caulobacter sp.]MBO9543765.1 glycoside hydrolase family 5 protein [Caulobacter sp.]
MVSIRKILAMGALAAALLALPAAAREISPEAQVAAMKRGVNIIGYDPLWKDPAKARFQLDRHFKTIKVGGFDTVRVNLQAFAHMDAEGRLDPQWLATLDKVVKEALAAKLTVILDEHDFDVCEKDPAACKPKLTAFWKQIAERYRTAPDGVVFELLNEPSRQLDPLWNDWVVDLLATVRASNPTRNVIVGPPQWNSFRRLADLKLPKADRHLIVTFHYYDPFPFTHQGASWASPVPPVGVSWGTVEEHARIDKDFDTVVAWAKAEGRPVLLGEFGAYDKGPIDSRIAYTQAVARSAERHGFAWAYWQFDSDFVVYDIKADAWNAPIHDALISQ